MTIDNKNQIGANIERNAIPQLVKSPATKYISGANGVNGTAMLSRPSYQTGKDTWVTEYTYKDKDVNVVIQQKMKVSSYNNKVRDYYVEQQIVNVEPFKNISNKSKNEVSEFLDSDLSNAADSNVENAFLSVREQMLANPVETMKAQARQSANGVLALME